jgi:hypothetical protein
MWLDDVLSTTACDELLSCVLGDETEVVSAFVVFFAIGRDCCDFCLVRCVARLFGDDVAFVSGAADAAGVDFFRGIEPSSSA